MAQTVLLASGTVDARSADLDGTVSSGAYVVFSLFAADGALSSGMQVAVEQKIGTEYVPIDYLTPSKRRWTNGGQPGIYTVRRTVAPEAIGVMKDA